MRNVSEQSRELVLFIDNDGTLYRQRTSPIRINLSKKYLKGIYDHTQAIKLWKYLSDDGAKKYAKEFSRPTDWNVIFSVADRNEAAKHLADDWLAEMEAGNFEGISPKKNPAPYEKNPAPFRGTTKPRRKSQITGLPPTKRLVKRRAKNTTPGYFPNPGKDPMFSQMTDRELQSWIDGSHKRKEYDEYFDRAITEMSLRESAHDRKKRAGYFPNPIKGEQYEAALHAAYNELSKAVNEKKNDITIQARVAYLEGIIDAGMYVEILSSQQYQMWKRKAAEMVKARVR